MVHAARTQGGVSSGENPADSHPFAVALTYLGSEQLSIAERYPLTGRYLLSISISISI